MPPRKRSSHKARKMFSQPSSYLFRNSLVDDKGVLFLDHPLLPGSLSGVCGEHSSIISSGHRRQSLQTPPKEPLSPQQGAAAFPEQQESFALPDTGHASVSDPDLDVSSLPGEAPGSLSMSQSEPLSNSSHRASKDAITSLESIYRRERNGRGCPRKRGSSTGLSCSSQPQSITMSCTDAWPERFPNYYFHNPEEQLPLSPPPSEVVVKHENIPSGHPAQPHISNNVPRYGGEIPRGPAEIHPHCNSEAFSQSPVVAIPQPLAAAGQQHQRQFSHPSASTLVTTNPPPASDMFSSPRPSSFDSTSWHSDDATGASCLPYTPSVHNHDAATWWPPVHTRFAQAQTPYQQPILLSPAPQRPMHYFGNQNEMLEDGLLQFGSSFGMSTAADSLFPPSNIHPAGPTMIHQQSPTYTYCNNPVPLHEKFPEFSQFSATPVHHRPRSPTLSPAARIPPEREPVAQTVKPSHRPSRSRKLSMQSSSGRRSAKPGSNGQSGSPSSPGTAQPISFVNFTAEDSHKILNGVAPSGSSKTKARRENEARERRRKLSEAAMKAVRQAGGDVDALESAFY